MIMGATEILKILEKGDKLTIAEITEKTNCSYVGTCKALSRLLKDVSENLHKRTLTGEEKIEKYGRKVGCIVYLYWLN